MEGRLVTYQGDRRAYQYTPPEPLRMVRRRVGDGLGGLQLRLLLKASPAAPWVLRDTVTEGGAG